MYINYKFGHWGSSMCKRLVSDDHVVDDINTALLFLMFMHRESFIFVQENG